MRTCDEWSGSVDWYDANMGEEGDALNRDLIRPIVLEMLGDTSERLVLDCGCGSGYVTAELARRSRKIVGIDFSAEFVAFCRRKYGAAPNMEFLLHDVTGPLPFDRDSVGAVLCKMVLQYVPEIATFATESWRVLARAGRWS